MEEESEDITTIFLDCYCCDKNALHIVFEGVPNYYECVNCGCVIDDSDLKQKENGKN